MFGVRFYCPQMDSFAVHRAGSRLAIRAQKKRQDFASPAFPPNTFVAQSEPRNASKFEESVELSASDRSGLPSCHSCTKEKAGLRESCLPTKYFRSSERTQERKQVRGIRRT